MGEWVKVDYKRWYYFDPSLFTIAEAMMDDVGGSSPGQPYYEEESHKLAYQSAHGNVQLRHRTKKERLNDAKRGLENKLAEINKALELLDKYPEMNEVIEALEKAGI